MSAATPFVIRDASQPSLVSLHGIIREWNRHNKISYAIKTMQVSQILCA